MGGGKGGGSKSVTVGYKYYMGMHMVICHGPVDSLNQIYAGERQIRGLVSSSSRILISAENVFGGEEKEGGIKGYVDVMFGEPTQTANSYLQSKVSSQMPAFRGVLSIVCNQIYFAAMNPYPKPWWFEVTRIPQSDWEPSYAEPRTGSANGAHIIRELITNTTWGMGYPISQIDNTSFVDAAETLYNENFGVSFILAAQGQIEDLLQQVLRHINGVLVSDRFTGLFKLKLIRDDYTVGNLPTFDDSNIIALDSFQRASYGEMVNEIVLVYRPQGEPKDDVVVFQNLASIQAQGAVISQTVQYPGIDHKDIAVLVGERELKQQSTPLASATLTVNREAWDIEPGDPIRFTWPEYGIEQMVLRVTKADYGNIGQGQIRLTCAEDIFGLPSVSYVTPQDPIWDDPITDPVITNANNVKIAEIPYFDIATYLTSFSALILDELEPTDVYLYYMASLGINAPAAQGFEAWTKISTAPDSAYEATTSAGYTPCGFLESAIGFNDTADIEFSNDTAFDVFDENLDLIYAYIDNEMVAVDSITSPTDVDLGKMTIRRGVLDTVPAEHAAGARVWFARNEAAYDPTEYQEATNIAVKILQITGIGIFPLASQTAIETGNLVARQYRPYPCARVVWTGTGMGNVFYPPAVFGPEPTMVNFVDRNRLQQTTKPLLDFTDLGITIEPTATYTIRWFGELDFIKTDANASRITTGQASGTHEWTQELTDAACVSYLPQRSDQSLEMPFSDNAIGGSLSDETTAQNVNNVTFGNNLATFAAGYFDIGDWTASSSWSYVLTFNPDDTGDDYQLLFGKFNNDGQDGGIDLFTLYWRRTDGQLYTTNESSTKIVVNDSYCRPGFDHHVLIVRKSTNNVDIILNGLLITTRAINGNALTGRDYTFGGAWQQQSATRINLFSGTMKDFRLWNGTELAAADMFLTSVDRPNRFFKLKITTVRDGVDSYQSFEHSPKRIGWDLFYNDNFNGRD
jgi:hypothetical protein